MKQIRFSDTLSNLINELGGKLTSKKDVRSSDWVVGIRLLSPDFYQGDIAKNFDHHAPVLFAFGDQKSATALKDAIMGKLMNSETFDGYTVGEVLCCRGTEYPDLFEGE